MTENLCHEAILLQGIKHIFLIPVIFSQPLIRSRALSKLEVVTYLRSESGIK